MNLHTDTSDSCRDASGDVTLLATSLPTLSPRRRRRRWPLLVALLVAAGLVVAGCSKGSPSGGVASVNPTGTSSQSSSSSDAAKPNALAYSQCMRAHGITKYPDPDNQGHISLTQRDGIDISSAQFQAAQQACKSLQPGAGSSSQQAQQAAGALKYAQCMRAHGVPKFPDPNDQGGFQIEPGSGMNPNSPQYQSADKTCHHFLAGQQGGGTVTKGLN